MRNHDHHFASLTPGERICVCLGELIVGAALGVGFFVSIYFAIH